MLVLSRKVGEKLVIDGNIIVEVVKIQGTEFRLALLLRSMLRFFVAS